MGQALIEHPDVAGVTFTGSYDVGMKIYRDFAAGKWVRPTILELGGKNPAIVSRNANLDIAATGIVRSAFGLQGQKCSACSRVYIEEPVYDRLVEKIVELTEKMAIGDPTDKLVNLGPVINKNSYLDYQTFIEELEKSGKILTGGKTLTDGPLATLYLRSHGGRRPAESHRLWKEERFLAITTVMKVKDLKAALALANDVDYGLDAGSTGQRKRWPGSSKKSKPGDLCQSAAGRHDPAPGPAFQPFVGWKGPVPAVKNPASSTTYLCNA